MSNARFNENQQRELERIIESRLARERRLFARQLEDQRLSADAIIASLRTELTQARNEQGVLRRLLGRWL